MALLYALKWQRIISNLTCMGHDLRSRDLETSENQQRASLQKDGEVLKTTDLITISTDIFIPAARPDVITEANADVLDAKLVIEGANIPISENAEKMLHDRGILVIPDFVANAGGVITASVEYHGGTETHAFEKIKSTIPRNTKEILYKVYHEKMYPREAALAIAKRRVLHMMKYRK